jgi:hypothetical protein
MGEWRSFDWVIMELVYNTSDSNGNNEKEGLAILVGLHEREGPFGAFVLMV